MLHLPIPHPSSELTAGAVLPAERTERLRPLLERLVGLRVAERLLSRAGDEFVLRASAAEIASTAEVPLRFAERVVAAREIASLDSEPAPAICRTSADIKAHLPKYLASLEVEVLLGLVLTPKLAPKALVLFAIGGSTGTSIEIRDVFAPLVRLRAASFVLIHTHPSGAPTPSHEDVVLTNALARAGRVLGIPLVDHLVVASGGTVSFFDVGLLPTEAELGPLTALHERA